MAVEPTAHSPTAPTAAIRGRVITFTGDPFDKGLQDTMVYESDAIVAFGQGAHCLA